MSNPPRDNHAEQNRMAANLQKAVELTELALDLRLSVMRRQKPDCTMEDVMHEIRLAKEQAWRPSHS